MALEVLDKAATPSELWLMGGAAAALGYFACRRWPWTLIFFGAAAVLLVWGSLQLYFDPDVGPAAWAEGGWPYATHVGATSLLAIILPLVGWWSGIRSRRIGASSRSHTDGA